MYFLKTGHDGIQEIHIKAQERKEKKSWVDDKRSLQAYRVTNPDETGE